MTKRPGRKRLAIESFESRQVLSAVSIGVVAEPALVEHPLSGEPHVVLAAALVSDAGFSRAAAVMDPATVAGALVSDHSEPFGAGLTPLDRDTGLTTLSFGHEFSAPPVESYDTGANNVLDRLTATRSVFVIGDVSFEALENGYRSDLVFTNALDVAWSWADSAALTLDGLPIPPLVAMDSARAVVGAIGVAFEGDDLVSEPDPLDSLAGIDYAAALPSAPTANDLATPTPAVSSTPSINVGPTQDNAALGVTVNPGLSGLASELAREPDAASPDAIEPLDDWFDTLGEAGESKPELQRDVPAVAVEDRIVPAPTERLDVSPSLERLRAIAAPAVPDATPGGGVIDLAAMLLPAPTAAESQAAPTVPLPDVRQELAARDAAFAVESWVRTVPQATSRAGRASVALGPVVAERPAAVSRWDLPNATTPNADRTEPAGAAEPGPKDRGDQARGNPGATSWIAALFGLSVAWGRWRRASQHDLDSVEPPRRDRGSKSA